jgi:hypothetical protein
MTKKITKYSVFSQNPKYPLADLVNPVVSGFITISQENVVTLLNAKDVEIAELKKKLLLRAKRINAAIDVIDCDFEDCKFEAVSILSGENDEAIKEQE